MASDRSRANIAQLRSPQAIEAIRSQDVKVRVFWAPNDGIIIPAQNSQWPTPTNPDPEANVKLGGLVNHLTIFSDANVITQTIAYLGT